VALTRAPSDDEGDDVVAVTLPVAGDGVLGVVVAALATR